MFVLQVNLEPIQWAYDSKRFFHYMSVDLGSLHGSMPEKFLNRPNICPSLKHMSGKAQKNTALDSMKHIKKKHTPEEILNLVNGHLEKDEGSKAKYLMTLTTGLGIKEKKDVVQGLRKLKVEDITKTDLTDINKFGCSFGAAALLLVSCSIIYILVF